ncbi:peroxisomal biogenesis factor 11 [Cladochytrium replicatum]|nr:peroxisomal biogenesis factor 11 [Cladochytrium replicatum]
MPQLQLIATADHSVKFLSTAMGRDRIYRFIQFYARYLVWRLQKNGGDKDTIERLQKLGSSLAQTRKLLSAGRQLEFVRGIQKALTVKDDITRLTTIVKNICLSIWLTYDFLGWAHTAGVYKFESIKEINKRGFQFWLLALATSILGNAHKLRLNAIKLELEGKSLRKSPKDETSVKAIRALKSERSKLVLATVQDSLDSLIPISALEYVNIESGYVGLIGAITSALGGYTQWTSL